MLKSYSKEDSVELVAELNSLMKKHRLNRKKLAGILDINYKVLNSVMVHHNKLTAYHVKNLISYLIKKGEDTLYYEQLLLKIPVRKYKDELKDRQQFWRI